MSQIHPVHPMLRQIRPRARRARPPNASKEQPPKPRLFTQNTQLLLLTRNVPRPQLPYLHHPLRAHNLRNRLVFNRLLTTQTKEWMKGQVYIAGKLTLYLWGFGAMFFIASLGFDQVLEERAFPCPKEWTYFTARAWHKGWASLDPEWQQDGAPQWAHGGVFLIRALDRLEREDCDGKDLKVAGPADASIVVPGAARTSPFPESSYWTQKSCYDISGKSEEWRRGYYTILMKVAQVGERLDGWIKDKTQEQAFPKTMVIGPSNPRPKPVPPGQFKPPKEENCEEAWPAPDNYYAKILVTPGFNTKQRLDAALAWGDWLDYRGLHDSAEEMYQTAWNIANSPFADHKPSTNAHPSTRKPDANAVSIPTNHITPNVLLAATSLATHYAQAGQTALALPVYLEVLRARRSAPAPITLSTSSTEAQINALASQSLASQKTRKDDRSTTSPWKALSNLMTPPPFPSPPPSGNESIQRTEGDICEEAALQSYIGEILFATSAAQRTAGLAWTRAAVDEALQGAKTGQNRGFTVEQKKKCMKCYDVGLNSMAQMLEILADEEREARKVPRKTWFGRKIVGEEGEAKWEREEKEVKERLRKFRVDGLRERYASQKGIGSMGGNQAITNRALL